jgi:hypothetical protein
LASPDERKTTALGKRNVVTKEFELGAITEIDAGVKVPGPVSR